MKSLAERIRKIVIEATDRLQAYDDAAAQKQPLPGKWSPKQVIGHLIDSAVNNHVRFVNAQLKEDLIFDGYDQNVWVAAQDYQSASWVDLVAFWKSYNLHLAHVVARISDTTAHREVTRHNLHQIALKPVPAHEPTTLAYLIEDYVDHLEHHLRGI